MGSDTIFALSSAPGKAGVAIIRVSGAGAFVSLRALARLRGAIKPREAKFASVRDPDSGDLIDQALVLPFAGPASFTGEDVVEYQLHGSPAIVSSLLEALSAFPGHRTAEPGEFTRRAFENGKLDLTEAEAVADLINAETQLQRRQALSQMGGALSELYEGWRQRLIRAMAYIEAVIDFPDEDVPDSETAKAAPDLAAIRDEIASHLNDNRRGERLRDGIRIAILGAPNAGKSSLLNALARRDVAIVSSMPGTTRDVLEVHLDISGYPVIVSDTAGLRDVADDSGHGSIESEGIRRARGRAEEADIRILMFDGTLPPDQATLELGNDQSIFVLNKADREGFDEACVPGAVSISASSGENLTGLLSALASSIAGLYGTERDAPSLTRSRHRAALEECISMLGAALGANAPELMAEDVRLAARAIGRITGRVDVEDLLDVIFRDFCIGK